MNTFLSFVRKETLHIVRDTRTMAIVLVMPVILLLLFGFAISTEVNNINVAAVVPEHGEVTCGMISRLEANPYISFKGCVTPDDAGRMLQNGDVGAVVMFTSDTDPEIRLRIDASNTNTAQSAAGYLRGILAVDKAGTPTATRTLYNPQLKSAYNFVPGIMGMLFILICAMMTSVSIVREKETGTMEVLLVSPIHPLSIVLSKLVPYFILSCIVLSTILLMAYTVLGLPWSYTAVHVIWVSIIYILLSLSIGMLVSTLTSRQFVALLVSAMLFMIPVIMLSGMLFPIENMPRPLQWLSCIVPARWYIDAMRKLMIEQLPVASVTDDIVTMSLMALAIVTVAVKKFNEKLQ